MRLFNRADCIHVQKIILKDINPGMLRSNIPLYSQAIPSIITDLNVIEEVGSTFCHHRHAFTAHNLNTITGHGDSVNEKPKLEVCLIHKW